MTGCRAPAACYWIATGVAALPVRPGWAGGPLTQSWRLAATCAPGIRSAKTLAAAEDKFMMEAGPRVESP